MLFNSIAFAIFLPIVFLLYWWIGRTSRRGQNILLLVASYVFYGWWDIRFLSLIFISSLVDYLVGISLGRAELSWKRRGLLLISLFANLGILMTFKYYNFFVSSIQDAFSLFGHPVNFGLLHIVLPVGISFYTFQTMSYTLDIYRREREPTREWTTFFAYVSFFPQLVAGPIERAGNLLPQFERKRTFDPVEAADGLRQMLWGFIKKMVIADSCAPYVNAVFSDPSACSGLALFAGAGLFAFQIYGDFSGYSDIAIGAAKLFDFKLMRNFAYPYFSRDIAEFWRRWHISLTTWFRDYVYIPLGGSHRGTVRNIINIFIIFLVSGFWHGANWTFLLWGMVNALCFLPLLLMQQHRKHINIASKGSRFPALKDLLKIILNFSLVCLGWVFFRSETVSDAFVVLKQIFSPSLFAWESTGDFSTTTLVLIILFVVAEWAQRESQHPLMICTRFPRPVRWGIYYLLIWVVYSYSGASQEFIYFQF